MLAEVLAKGAVLEVSIDEVPGVTPPTTADAVAEAETEVDAEAEADVVTKAGVDA